MHTIDTIKFNIIMIKDNFFDVEILLNNEKLKHSTFNLIESIAMSMVDSGEFDLFTCTCGVSGCAGFSDMVQHNKTDKIVSWLFPKEYNVSKKLFTFNRKDFELSFMDLYKSVQELDLKGMCSMSDYDDMTDLIHTGDENKLSKLLPTKDVVEKCIGQFNLLIKFKEVCKENMPFLNRIYFEYNGYKDSCSPYELVQMVLNESPTGYRYRSFSWLRVGMACKAINELIFNNNKRMFIYLDNRGYQDKPLYKLNLLTRLSMRNDNNEIMFFQDDEITINQVSEVCPEDFAINDNTSNNNFKITYS